MVFVIKWENDTHTLVGEDFVKAENYLAAMDKFYASNQYKFVTSVMRVNDNNPHGR